MVHMSNNTHVTDVLGEVHEHTDLLDSEFHHAACYVSTQAISLSLIGALTAPEPTPILLFNSAATEASQPVCA